MNMMEAQQRKERFIELRAYEGMSLSQCSEELSVSKTTLIKWQKNFFKEITALKKAQLQFLIDKLELGLRARLTSLSELNKMLSDELMERDFKDIPSDKLVVLLLSLHDKVSYYESHICLKPLESDLRIKSSVMFSED